MADPYGNYLANLSPFAGPGLQPLGLSPEDMANLGITKPGMDPGLSSIVGRIGAELAVPMAVSSATNASRLGEAGMAGIIPGARPMSTDEMIPAAAKATMDMAMRGVAHAPEGVGVFGGRLSLDPAANQKITEALGLAGEGVKPGRIWDYTKAWTGPEGLGRYEIPDTGSTLTKSAADFLTRHGKSNVLEAPMSQILQHPAAYEAYPGLANIPTRVGTDYAVGSGWFNPNPGMGMPGINARSNDLMGPKGVHGVLLHELQHAIQTKEGFTPGWSSEMAAHEGNQFLNKLDEMFKNEAGKPGYSENRDKIASMIADFKANFNPYDAYKRAAGEIEARAVQKRMMSGPDYLSKIDPMWNMTQDIPRDKWIVRRPGLP